MTQDVTQPQPDVYLSHSSRDNTFAQKLAWALRGAGAETWFDPNVRDSSTPPFHVGGESEKRNTFVVIVSRAALASTWATDELNVAVERYMQSLKDIDRLSLRIRRSNPQYATTFDENRIYLQRHIVPVVIDALTEDDFTGEWRIVWDLIASNGPLVTPLSEEQILRQAIAAVGASYLPFMRRAPIGSLILQGATAGNILAYLPVPLEAEGSVEELVRRGREASLELGVDAPEITNEGVPAVWCVVANIAKEQHYGRPDSGQDREGTKHFAAGAKVYGLPAQWGDGYDRIVVIGHHRESKRYVKMVLPAMRLTNWRAALVYSPYVIAQIGAEWDGTAASRLHAEQIAQWCLWRAAPPDHPA